MMDVLRRDAAPLSERIWNALDEAVATEAKHILAARRIATFDGPRGWDHLATPLGTMTPCQTSEGKAAICVPSLVLLAEIRSDFRMPWTTLEAFERGAPSLEADPAEAAAREVALAEVRLVLSGDPVGQGFLNAGESPRVQAGDWSRPGELLADVLRAVELLDTAGIPGPYEAVLPPRRYYAYFRALTGEGGYPAARQLRDSIAAVHRSVVMRENGAVFSTRGGDFIITVGGDLSVGYRRHDGEGVHLFCLETVTAQTQTPKAVCILT